MFVLQWQLISALYLVMCLVISRYWAGLGSDYDCFLPRLYQYDDLTTLCIPGTYKYVGKYSMLCF